MDVFDSSIQVYEFHVMQLNVHNITSWTSINQRITAVLNIRLRDKCHGNPVCCSSLGLGQ